MHARLRVQARLLEEEILDLADRAVDAHVVQARQGLYTKVGSFLFTSEVLKHGHWWCTFPTMMTFMLRLVEMYPNQTSVVALYETMVQQQKQCRLCVDAYHGALEAVRLNLEGEFTPNSVCAFFHKLAELDVERVHQALSSIKIPKPMPMQKVAMQTGIKPSEEQKIVLEVLLYEILSYRRLWSDFRVLRVLGKWLSTEWTQWDETVDAASFKTCPGLYQCMVSPEPNIRGWAKKQVASLRLLDSTSVQPLLPIFDEWTCILERNAFNTSLLAMDIPNVDELRLDLYLEPGICINTPTDQILWGALDMIMQKLDNTALEGVFESFDNLPDLVLNYLGATDPATTNQQVALMISKCYGSLLNCLGYRFWIHTVHSPREALELVLRNCSTEAWRPFVTKQMIELIPSLVASMRTPFGFPGEEQTNEKGKTFFGARDRVFSFFLNPTMRPAHFKEETLEVAALKAISTIVRDCYEQKTAFVAQSTTQARAAKLSDGELPDFANVDFSIVDSSFWWPCGNAEPHLEELWVSHLFDPLVNPRSVVALIDHIALTCATALSKHLHLAREIAYSCMIDENKESLIPKPVITILLKKLCEWETVATIPLPVHGALFETLGGIAEILTVLSPQVMSRPELGVIESTMKECESIVRLYLNRMTDEVVIKGLSNPLGFPLIAQHLGACLMSPTTTIVERIKQLLLNAAKFKAGEDEAAFLIVSHRQTGAFLRGVLTILQVLRLYDFAMPITLPAAKKLVLLWSSVFEKLSDDVRKTISSQAKISSPLSKVPTLLGDFIMALVTNLFAVKQTRIQQDEDMVMKCLQLGISFWGYWSSEPGSLAGSKRYCGLIIPLVKCIQQGQSSAKCYAAEFLMILLEAFLNSFTPLGELYLSLLETLRGMGSIESKRSTDFGGMAKRLRNQGKVSSFFAPKLRKTSSNQDRGNTAKKMGSRPPLSVRPITPTYSSLRPDERSSTRPMSGKAAARAQARLAAERSAANTIFDHGTKKDHSFYSEDDIVSTTSSRPSSTRSQGTKARQAFDLKQVTKGIVNLHSRPQMLQASQLKQAGSVDNASDTDESTDDEEEASANNLAVLFLKIKRTTKASPLCSLLPFYRELLQACMPSLLTNEFENERNGREFSAPSLAFEKVSEYTNAFLPLLVEECQNEVEENLRVSVSQPSGHNWHRLRYESEKSKEGMRCLSFSVVEAGTTASGARKADRFFRNEKLFRNCDVVFCRVTTAETHFGKREFIGVVLISETERGRRRQGGRGQQGKNEEQVKVLFLNDGELDTVTSDIASFKSESLTSAAMADSEWQVRTLSNLVTSTREYIALRSVGLLPEHLRSIILAPDQYKTSQTELIQISSVLEEWRSQKQAEKTGQIVKALKHLDRMDVTLVDLRSTGIGKVVNKLRKHENSEVSNRANLLKEKWTGLMAEKDALNKAPRYVSGDLWNVLKLQYNQSQLQSIHSVLNNYRGGISLLQGPPGTGKTKTIMGLLSGFLALEMPNSLLLSGSVSSSLSSKPPKITSDVDTTNYSSDPQASSIPTGPTTIGMSGFSLSGGLAGSRILRQTDTNAQAKQTTIQKLKNATSVHSRLEQKLSSRSTNSLQLIQRTMAQPSCLSRPSSKRSHVLLCAPSNGAVDELVLRIVTDGLLDSSGNVVVVGAPSVHASAASSNISIVRLGNPGEDAPESVKAVCLPQIIKKELASHPKTILLRSLQERQRTLRTSIRDFHLAAEAEEGKKKGDRRALAKMHAELTECSGKVRRLLDEVTALESKMNETVLSSSSIIACTLSKAGSGVLTELKRGFDALIIDEAAQAVELSTLVPVRERVARVVLVGDPKQLPATVKSVVAAQARYDRSLFERIAESGVAPCMLRVQYRMHPFLREFPSKQFYGGLLTDGPSVMERVQKVCTKVYAHSCFQPFLVYDLTQTTEENAHGGSKCNRVEAAFCVELFKTMVEKCPDVRLNRWSVGFVSPYKEQVRVLRQEVMKASLSSTLSVEVNTVDGFQGREKDVIIFSCVRSSARGGVGFLKDIRRMNVAITRAKFCLFLVGNTRTLYRDETWAALIDNARQRRLLLRASSTSFSKVYDEVERDTDGLREHYRLMRERLDKKASIVAPEDVTVKNEVSDQKPLDLKDNIKDERIETAGTTNERMKQEADLKTSFDDVTVKREKREPDDEPKFDVSSKRQKTHDSVSSTVQSTHDDSRGNREHDLSLKVSALGTGSTQVSSYEQWKQEASLTSSDVATKLELKQDDHRSEFRPRERERSQSRRHDQRPSSSHSRSHSRSHSTRAESNSSNDRSVYYSRSSTREYDQHSQQRSQDTQRKRERSAERSDRKYSLTQDVKRERHRYDEVLQNRSEHSQLEPPRTAQDRASNRDRKQTEHDSKRPRESDLERSRHNEHRDRQNRLRALRDGEDPRRLGRFNLLTSQPSPTSGSTPQNAASAGGLLDRIIGSTSRLSKATARAPTRARRDYL